MITPPDINKPAHETFWQLTCRTRMDERNRVDLQLKSLQHMPLDTLKLVLLQHRFFIHYYIADRAFLIAKLPCGTLRSILCDLLNDELGAGTPENSHAALYDKFLLSIGIAAESLDAADTNCIRNLRQIQQSLIGSSWGYGVGLRGMGAECLCRIYLSALHQYLRRNPAIIELKNSIAWEFWDIHDGAADLQRQIIIKAAIDELIKSDPQVADDLTEGYLGSQSAGERFWQELYRAARCRQADLAALPQIDNHSTSSFSQDGGNESESLSRLLRRKKRSKKELLESEIGYSLSNQLQ